MLNIKNLMVNLNKKILQSDKTIIIPHKEVDFDAIASSVGVSLISKELKKENHILVNDNKDTLDIGALKMLEEVEKEYPVIDLQQYNGIKTKDTLNVLCDVSKPPLSHVKSFDKDNLAIIDHHDKDCETFDASLSHIDPSVTSASEIVANLLLEYDIKVPLNVANMLVAGILLDTADLHNADADKTMDFIKVLRDKWNTSVVKGRKYFIIDYESDKKVHELISRVDVYEPMYSMILADENKKYTKEQLAAAANYVLRYPVDSSFSIGNIGNGIISVSARSKDILDSGKVMRELSGGGGAHSGATKLTNTTVKEVGDKIKELVNPIYKK